MGRESALFYVVLSLFALTGVVTILGIIQKVSIERKYLNTLFSAFILELIAAVLLMFSHTNFFTVKVREGDLFIPKAEIPEPYQNMNNSKLLTRLGTLHTCEGKRDQLKALISKQNPSYDSLSKDLNSKIAQINEISDKYNHAKSCEEEYNKLKKQFLVKMANLNILLSQWGTSINLRWHPEEKRIIAQRLQEAFKEIGFMKPNDIPNDDPEKAYELLVAYQTEKNFRRKGFLTSEVIAFIIKDYLS